MIEFADIQGNILRGYTFPFAQFSFVSFENTAAARSWLSSVVDSVTTAEDWGGQAPKSTFNIAFTFLGLRKFGVAESILASFSETFRMGMAERSRLLGDTGASAPGQWENQLGTPDAIAGTHAVVSIYGRSETDINARFNTVLPNRFSGVSVINQQKGKLLPLNREHFGFRDGISQPPIEGATQPRIKGGGLPTQNGDSSPLAVGEFVLGYPGQSGIQHSRPLAPFDKNCTYMVYRKLYQDVAGFRSYVSDAATKLRLDPESVASRIVGRWPDGTPVILSPNAPDEGISGDPDRVNNFQFSQDPRGLGCPIGAHIRRSNPRDGLAGGFIAVEGHRIIRRGIPYGKPLPVGSADDRQDRGLIFVAFNVNIREQFEFVQRLWLNDSGFTGVLDPNQKDVVAGNNDGTGTMTLPMKGFPRQLQEIPSFITLRHGAYLLVASMRALRSLTIVSN